MQSCRDVEIRCRAARRATTLQRHKGLTCTQGPHCTAHDLHADNKGALGLYLTSSPRAIHRDTIDTRESACRSHAASSVHQNLSFISLHLVCLAEKPFIKSSLLEGLRRLCDCHRVI